MKHGYNGAAQIAFTPETSGMLIVLSNEQELKGARLTAPEASHIDVEQGDMLLVHFDGPDLIVYELNKEMGSKFIRQRVRLAGKRSG